MLQLYRKFLHLNVGGATIYILYIDCCAVDRFINRTGFIVGQCGTLVYNCVDHGTEKTERVFIIDRLAPLNQGVKMILCKCGEGTV